MYAVPDNGKSAQMFDPQMLSHFGTILCSDSTVLNYINEGLINNNHDEGLMTGGLPEVKHLGNYYKRGFVEILDPTLSKDPSGFDKCYWLVYYSVMGFLKTLKEDQEKQNKKLQRKQIELDDIVNKSSKGLKKKPRKKEINKDINFVRLNPSLDLEYKKLQFSLEHTDAQIEEVDDISNQKPQNCTKIIFGDLIEVSLINETSENAANYNTDDELKKIFRLFPPELNIDNASDSVNFPHKDHQETLDKKPIQQPLVYYLYPPLHYLVDIKDLLPFKHQPMPDLSQEEDKVNKPQPVSQRYYIDDVIFIPVNEEISISSTATRQHNSLLLLSPPGSPTFPRSDPDTVNHPQISPDHNLSSCPISTNISCIPSKVTEYSLNKRIFGISAPQLALYTYLEDDPRPKETIKFRKVSKSIPGISVMRPNVSVTLDKRPSLTLSPPQSPLLPARRESKAEDLFDQVRRHSRGIIRTKIF